MNRPDCSRRDFGIRSAALLAALATPTAISASETADEEAVAPEDLLLEVILRRYPDERLTPEVLEEIRGEIAAHLLRSRILSGFPLENGDEPAFTFAAYRGRDGG